MLLEIIEITNGPLVNEVKAMLPLDDTPVVLKEWSRKVNLT